MNPNFEAAILEFIGNEFHLDPENLGPDLNFKADLHLDDNQFQELLQHMQDALSFSIPEDKIDDIETVGDLIAVITQPDEEDLSYDPTD